MNETDMIEKQQEREKEGTSVWAKVFLYYTNFYFLSPPFSGCLIAHNYLESVFLVLIETQSLSHQHCMECVPGTTVCLGEQN